MEAADSAVVDQVEGEEEGQQHDGKYDGCHLRSGYADDEDAVRRVALDRAYGGARQPPEKIENCSWDVITGTWKQLGLQGCLDPSLRVYECNYLQDVEVWRSDAWFSVDPRAHYETLLSDPIWNDFSWKMRRHKSHLISIQHHLAVDLAVKSSPLRKDILKSAR